MIGTLEDIDHRLMKYGEVSRSANTFNIPANADDVIIDALNIEYYLKSTDLHWREAVAVNQDSVREVQNVGSIFGMLADYVD